MATLRLLMSMRDRINRKQYLAWGLGLMVLKYAAESALLWWIAGIYLSPLEFLNPLSPYRIQMSRTHFNASDWFPTLALVWSLPFVWIGVSMSVRRAADAGHWPWWGLLFFLPYVNYALMIYLSFAPSHADARWSAEPAILKARSDFKAAYIGTFLSVAVGLLILVVSVFLFKDYGLSLFVGAPLIMGAITAYVYNRPGPRPIGATLGVALLPLLIASGCMLLLALEGVICLLMAVPIAVPLAIIGSLIGQSVAIRWSPGTTQPNVIVVLGLFPLMALTEAAVPREVPLREVLSVAEIDASPEKVWPLVVEFPDLETPDEWFFKLGVAYPLRARIDGQGVGAIRHCQFSTGDFVEPITAWEAPSRLAFDVKFQPRPMKELSPYERVHAPHLDGFIRSERGEFRLIPLANGRTRLEGRTWYRVNIHPGSYWQIYSDYFIHRIHLRVLEHIRRKAEA